MVSDVRDEMKGVEMKQQQREINELLSLLLFVFKYLFVRYH